MSTGAAFAIVLVGACTGSIGREAEPDSAGSGTGGDARGGQGGNAAGHAGTAGVASACLATPALRTTTTRLTAVQYARTLTVATGLPPSRFLPLPAAVALGGNAFDNNIEALEISHDLVSRLAANAETAADALDIATIAPCAAGDTQGRRTCGASFLRSFGARAFRRPLDESELARYQSFLDGGIDKFGYDTAIRLTVRALLQAPPFSYIVEETESGPDGLAVLTPHALASRLSYALTQAPPDAALLDAAARRQLRDDSQIRAQAERLLSRDKASEVVARFFAGWLDLRAPDYDRKKSIFAGFTREQADSIPSSLARFVDFVFWDQDATLRELFSSNRAFVNPALATLWNTTAPPSGWHGIDLQPDRHAGGLLTQPAWLAALNPPKALYRGLFVARRLLCAEPPSPPQGVTPDLGEDDAQLEGKPLTDRQRLELLHEKGACAGCHKAIDAPGFAFEHYDELGRWRDRDHDQPIDSTGVLAWDTDIDGPFDDGLQLAGRLAASRTVQACLAREWFRYTHGRTEIADDPADACAIETLARAFADAGGDMRELVLNVVSASSFRTRAWTVERPQ